MVRIHVTQIHEGDTLTKDIFNDRGLLVLSAGTVMKHRDIALLIRHHMDMVDIEARPLTVEEAVSPSQINVPPSSNHIVHEEMQKGYMEATRNVESIFQDVIQHGFLQDELVQSSITPLIQQMEKQRDVVSLLLLTGLEG